MKVVRTLLTTALLLFFFQNQAQTLRGVVRDGASGERLVGASLTLRPATTAAPATTVTDTAGAYVFRAMKPGIYQLDIDYGGYRPMVIWDIRIAAGKETVLDIDYDQSLSLPEMSVLARANPAGRPLPPLGAVPLTRAQTERVAATFFDPARLAQAYPGVSGNDDQANGMSIRGNSPAGVRWRLEGLDVVNPNHLPNAGTFADRPVAASGGVLLFSAQLLDNSTLLTGSLPAGYGDALAGTMDIRLRPGNDRQHEFTFQAGLLGLDAAAEGPLTGRGKSSYLVNYRYSTVGLLSQMGIPFGDEKIVFQDLSIHLAAPRTRAGDFNVFVLFGNSANDFQHKPDSAAIEAYKDVFDIDYTSRTLIAGAGWQKQLGRRTRIKAAHAHSGQVNDRIAQPGGIANGMYQKDYSDEQIAASSLSLSHYLPGRWRLDEGVSYVLKQYRYDIGRDSETSGGDFKTETVQPWAQASWASASGQTSVVAGVHGLLWLNETAIAEPRFSAVQRFGRRHSLSASWGIHSQTPAWWQYDGQLIRSSQTGLRYAWHSTDEAWRASLEGFWQTISDAAALFYPNGPVSVLNESEAPFPYFTGQKGQSEGRNYGVELGAEHRFAAGWFLLANATFFRAQTRLENRGWENSRWDLRRIVHLSGGKEWQKTTGERKTRAFGCSGRLTWSGGMRAMPIDLAASEAAAGTVFDAAAGFRVQQPDFFRLDGRVYWRTSIGDRRNSTFAMDFQNMTLRENVAYRYYDPWTKQVETKLQLGLIPNLSWRLEL